MQVQPGPWQSSESFPTSKGVYLISDREVCKSSSVLIDRLLLAMDAGVLAVQLREKDLDDDAYLELANDLATRRRTSTPIVVNRRTHLVGNLNASAVQIGVDQLGDIEAMRNDMPAGTKVGVSCHSLQELRKAQDAGVEFATIGPLFPTPSKPEAREFIEPHEIAIWQLQFKMPLFALGGIGLLQAKILAKLGVPRIACIRAVLNVKTSAEVPSRVSQLSITLSRHRSIQASL